MESIMIPKVRGFAALALFAALTLIFGCDRKSPTESHKESSEKSAPQASHKDDKDHAQKPEEHDDHDDHEAGEQKHREGEEEDHAGEEGPDEHGEEQLVRLTPEEMKEFGIEVQTAAPGEIDQYVDLPGEIVLNSDRLAHVVPRVQGIVRQVFASSGDRIRGGQVLAVIESRELADSKAEFLAARERIDLARVNFEREEMLWQKKVSSEQEYLDAKQALAEARIALNSAEQKLHALGFSETYLNDLPRHPDATFTRFEIRAPFAGTVIEKHITLGETLKEDAEAFTIADLATVWVDIKVYQKDLAMIRKGQEVVIEVGHDIPDATGEIAWVSPVVGESTRTANARVVLANPEGILRPGLFVTAKVAVASNPVKVRVPKTALQTVEERTVVFVQEDEGFEPRPVQVGQESAGHVEIVSGLDPGQKYVSLGAFTLKAQLSKGAFGDGHAH